MPGLAAPLGVDEVVGERLGVGLGEAERRDPRVEDLVGRARSPKSSRTGTAELGARARRARRSGLTRNRGAVRHSQKGSIACRLVGSYGSWSGSSRRTPPLARRARGRAAALSLADADERARRACTRRGRRRSAVRTTVLGSAPSTSAEVAPRPSASTISCEPRSTRRSDDGSLAVRVAFSTRPSGSSMRRSGRQHALQRPARRRSSNAHPVSGREAAQKHPAPPQTAARNGAPCSSRNTQRRASWPERGLRDRQRA